LNLRKFSPDRDGDDWTGSLVVLDAKNTVSTVNGPLPLIGIRRSESGDARDLDDDKSRNCPDFDSCFQNECPNKTLITDGNQDCGRRSAMAQSHVAGHTKRSRDDLTEVDSRSGQSVTIQGDMHCGREGR
jgi:hypothetical protein